VSGKAWGERGIDKGDNCEKMEKRMEIMTDDCDGSTDISLIRIPHGKLYLGSVSAARSLSTLKSAKITRVLR
jgi:hypothetical protein